MTPANGVREARADGGVVDTMVGFPKPREERRSSTTSSASRRTRRRGQEMEFPARVHVQGRAALRARSTIRSRCSSPRWTSTTSRRRSPACRRRARSRRTRIARVPRPLLAVVQRRPQPGHGRGAQDRRRPCRSTAPRRVHCWGTGLIPQVPINDKKMYPIYAKCIELDVPIFVYAGVPGPRIRYAPQDVGTARRGVLVLPRAARSSPATAASRGAELDGEAAPEVAEPLLLDHRVRAEALHRRHHRLREHARRRQGHLRGLLPRWGSTSTASSPRCPTCRSAITCGPSSCARTRRGSLNGVSGAGRSRAFGSSSCRTSVPCSSRGCCSPTWARKCCALDRADRRCDRFEASPGSSVAVLGDRPRPAQHRRST